MPNIIIDILGLIFKKVIWYIKAIIQSNKSTAKIMVRVQYLDLLYFRETNLENSFKLSLFRLVSHLNNISSFYLLLYINILTQIREIVYTVSLI